MEETLLETEFTLDNETISEFISKPRNWEMPYFDNFSIVPTDQEPTFAGLYRNMGKYRKNGKNV